MSRLKMILAAGIVTGASFATAPAAYAQSDRQDCPREALCLYSEHEMAGPAIPAGKDVSFYPYIHADRVINNSGTNVAVCGELLCQFVSANSGNELRATPAGSVFWR